MQRGDGSYRRAKNCETAVSSFSSTYVSFLNFVLVSSGCSQSLTVSSITMESLGKYFMRNFQIALC